MQTPQVIWIPSQIESGTYLKLAKKIINTFDPVILLCFGYGGDVSEANGVVSAIMGHGNVTGVLIGECSSSHALILAACQKRFALPNSKLCLHPIRISIQDTFSAKELKEYADNLAAMDKLAVRLFAQNSNKDLSWWEQLYYNAPVSLAELTETELYELNFCKPITEEIKHAISRFNKQKTSSEVHLGRRSRKTPSLKSKD